MGLYWARPHGFLPMDANSRRYVTEQLKVAFGTDGPKGLPTAEQYIRSLKDVQARFDDANSPVHTYPALSFAAWQNQPHTPQEDESEDESENGLTVEPHLLPLPMPESYTLDHILNDGCFLPREDLDRLLARLRHKKNLILQGPPGTGKTWLARRLAFALMGRQDQHALRVLQFHPNLSYEDFVRGWRPSGDGKLELVDGPLMELIALAQQDPGRPFVMVIEEINRGNPAQIFGEMLTLLEADKRTPAQAIELCHRRANSERVYIPPNIFVIGTMNIADRSLALVDFALRRRFAFVTLEPRLGPPWRDWMVRQFRVPDTLLADVESRMLKLNQTIADDATLGRAFTVGHSFVTPPGGHDMTNARAWFLQVFDTEIGPLLHEYWFDAADKAESVLRDLKEGF